MAWLGGKTPVEEMDRDGLIDEIMVNNNWFERYEPEVWRRLTREGFSRAPETKLRRVVELQRCSIKKISGRFPALSASA